MLPILESIQRAYGYLPVAALKRVSQVSGAPYALIYGTATYYRHLRFEKPGHTVAVCLLHVLPASPAPAESLDPRQGVRVRRSAAGRRPAASRWSSSRLTSPAPSPLVTLDGKPQPVTAAGAAAWARALPEGAWHDRPGILTTPARFPRLLLPATPAHNPLDLDEAVAAGAFTACGPRSTSSRPRA
jgi:hypothetical protein